MVVWVACFFNVLAAGSAVLVGEGVEEGLQEGIGENEEIEGQVIIQQVEQDRPPALAGGGNKKED